VFFGFFSESVILAVQFSYPLFEMRKLTFAFLKIHMSFVFGSHFHVLFVQHVAEEFVRIMLVVNNGMLILFLSIEGTHQLNHFHFLCSFLGIGHIRVGSFAFSLEISNCTDYIFD
jgi:hypothetical protein